MKNNKKLYLFIFLLIVNILNVSASTTNSSNYKTDIVIASGGEDINSANYNTNVVTGMIIGNTNSTNYKQSLGFFYASGGTTAYVEYFPNDPSPLINTTSGTNETYQDLNCFDTITDSNPQDKLNVTIKWYKNDSLQLTVDYNDSYTNGFEFNSILSSGNTSLNDVWICGMRLYDGKNYSNWQNSSNLTIIDPGMHVIANEFNGSTTEFLALSDIELQIIQNMTLEVTTYGKIIFNEIINLTENEENNTIDLDYSINIANNIIDINTTELTSLNKSATLYLYGLGFDNPRILRNGEVCSSSICQIINYSGGTLEFNVTMFTTYSAEETPSGRPVGGEGAPAPLVTDFIIDTDLIKVSIKQGYEIRKSIDVMNIGDVALDIDLELKDIRKFIDISEDSFSLEPGKVKTVNLDIFAGENEIPDVYTGRIIVKGDGIRKAINVIIEVKERKPMFDILTKVSDKKLKPGDKVQADIRIVNIGDLEHINVLLYYSIKNLEGKTITYREESLAIDKELKVVKTLEIPDDIEEGKYLFYSKVSYDDVIAASVDIFEVEKVELLAPKKPISINKKYLIIGISSIIVVILILFMIKIYKKIKPSYKIKEENKLNKESIKSLDDYIKKTFKMGFNKEVIGKKLLSAGWPKNLVKDELIKLKKR